MFILNDKQKGLSKTTEPHVVSVLNSINEPKIAAADHSAEPTQAYVCTISEGKNLLTHIVLYLTKSHERVMYTWDEGPVSAKKQPEVEGEALDFVENMGFMMDNLNLAKFSDAQRKELLADLPVFEAIGTKSEPIVLIDELEESLDDLIQVGASQDAPTAVASPVAGKLKHPSKPAPALDFSEDESLLLMEAEFARDATVENDSLGGFDFVPPAKAPAAKAPTPAREASAQPMVMDKTRFKAVLRFLSSL